MSKDIERAYSAESSQNAVSTSDQDCVFAQLTDMFGDVASQDLINRVCASNSWRVDDCIEALIKYLEFYGSDVLNEEPVKAGSTNPSDASQGASTNNDAEANAEIVPEGTLPTTDNFMSGSSWPDDNMITENGEGAASPQDSSTDDNSQQVKLLGAIPKNSNSTTNHSDTSNSSNSKPYPTIDFSSILQKGFKEFVTTSSCTTTTTTTALAKKREASESPEIENVLKNINAGYKVMIIMRGAPGCGKSFLARTIVDRTVKGDYRNHIFSADDYFYDVNDRYIYRKEKLQEAHEFNQRRVRKRALHGWSPIIVDNTNTKIWEMTPYVKFGVRNGYIIELIVPDTAWSHSAGKLAAKNKHGVPKETIEKMLSNFEPITVDELLATNHLEYTTSIPQLRHHPPLPMSVVCEDTRMDASEENKVTCTDTADTPSTSNSASWGQYEDNSESKKVEETKCDSEQNNDMPKPARNINKRKREVNSPSDDSEDTSESNPADDVEWRSFEEESNDFWKTGQLSTIKKNIAKFPASPSEPKPPRNFTNSVDTDVNIFNILKEQVGSLTSSERDDSNAEKSSKKIERHRFGCKNESRSFAMIRQIYPNKQADGLWDLFEKCNGDVDWAVDILLKDDSCVDQEAASGFNQKEYFYCRCDENEAAKTPPTEERSQSASPTNFKLPKQKSRKDKDKTLSAEMLEAKQLIEKQFKLGDQYYSSHVRKIRDLRHGTENDVADIADVQPEEIPSTNEEKDNEDDTSSCTSSAENDNEMIEINLGNELINQLEGIFGTECAPKYSVANFKTNVFMPKTMAKQLYALWMESVYNQIEEQRQTAIKEDEEFARILEDPMTYEKYPNPPNNYKEVLDMELAWNIYKSEFEDWRDTTPRDLASHLTQMKLCEIFPNIDKDTLLEIFAAHGNRFTDTVEVLKTSLKDNIEERMKSKEKELYEKVKIESAKFINNRSVQLMENTETSLSPTKKTLAPEEAKRQVLKDFEECRNLAVHHSQLKAECFQKAKEAIQNGSTAVAVYYSQIASLHKNKVDMYNHKAANCIMEVHDLNQNNPDFIDLHYLHVMEAIQCLDIFIDKHIHKMKNMCRSYKHLFIITGRGLHSASGVSTIKNKVKSRLKQRNLKWSEVNPGLLKVKVFSASRYSKNV